MTDVRILERVSRNAPLGVRFWDPVDATAAVHGLVVEVFLSGSPRARTRALPSRSGVYVAHRLPASAPPSASPAPGESFPRDFEFRDAEPDELWPAAARPYRVEVRDPQGRFLPVAFDADLPARGLFTWQAGWTSPPQAMLLPGEAGSPPQLLLERVPLFSAPARAVPDPLAVVRAQLRESGTRREAAGRLLGVSIDGLPRGVGLADERGRVAVIFPYPEPPRMSLGSPPEARNDFTWEVELTVFAPPRTSPPRPPSAPVDLADVFAALASAGEAVGATASPAVRPRLTYREALTVRTPGALGADAPYLWVAA